MYEFFKDFAGPIATICVSAAAGFITWSYNNRQLVIAQDKPKLDLFDRRYEYFKATEELIVLLGQQVGKDQVDMVGIMKLREKIEEMRFFFGAEVQGFIKELLDLIMPLVGVILKLAEQRRQHEAGEKETGELNCAAEASRSSLLRSLPVHRRGSGECQDIRRFKWHCATMPSTLSACPESTLHAEAQPGQTAVVRDPYARWCGRGGAARRPPIPITGQAIRPVPGQCGRREHPPFFGASAKSRLHKVDLSAGQVSESGEVLSVANGVW